MAKLKTLIKSLELRLSDFFLLIGIVPFIVLAAFTTSFMDIADPSKINLSLGAIIACFVISCIGYIAYLFYEGRKKNFKFSWFLVIPFILMVVGVLGVISQPASDIERVPVRIVNDLNKSIWPDIAVGQFKTVTTTISDIHRIYFALYVPLIFVTLYILFFVLPKRFKNKNILLYLSYGVFAAMAFILIYSFCTEGQTYIDFLKSIFSGNMNPPCVQSILGHRNAFGMAMFIGMISAFVAHSFTKKWYYYLIAGIFYLFMIFSFCKSSLVIAAIVAVIYVYFRLIFDYKNHVKRNKILLITYSVVIVAFVGIFAISMLTKKGFIYDMVIGATSGGTIEYRRFIWDNSAALISQGNQVIGRGFGVVNEILRSMNTVNGDVVYLTHNAFVAMLTEGGLFFLFAYIGLLIYSGYIIVKNFKKDINLMAILSLAIVAFFFYSFIESNQYIIYMLLVPVFIINQIDTEKEKIA